MALLCWFGIPVLWMQFDLLANLVNCCRSWLVLRSSWLQPFWIWRCVA